MSSFMKLCLEEIQAVENNLTHFATLKSVSKNRNHGIKYNCEAKFQKVL